MDEPNRAYLAGFFDGEGCVGTQNNTGRRGKPSVPTVIIQLSQRDRSALERVREETGFGYIARQASGSHILRIGSRDEVRAFIRLIYPYARLKRGQLRLAYAAAGRQQKTPRRPTSELDRRRRLDLAQQIADLNLAGRAKPVQNRAGSSRFVVARLNG